MINEKCAFRLYDIISNKSLISIYAGITTILICINTVYIIFHSINCEEFYKIPATYFTNISTVEFFREIIPLVFIILFIIFSKWISRTKTETIIDESLVAISAGVIVTIINFAVVYNCLGILYISPPGRVMLEQYPMVITIILIIVFAGIPMFLSSTYKKNENQVNEYFTAIFKKFKIKPEVPLKIMHCIMVCIGIVNAIVTIVFIFGMGYIALASIEMKIQYEIMTTIDGDYAVLSEYDGNILVVPIDMSKDAHEAAFYTNKYSFKARTDGVFKNIVFTRPPEIVYE